MTVHEQIKQYFVENAEIVPENDDDLFEKGILDSVAAIEFLAFLEETFDIEMSNDDVVIENFSSINNIAKLLDEWK